MCNFDLMTRYLLPITFLLSVLFLFGCSDSKQTTAHEIFEVKRGDLRITVVENGNLEALESVSIVNQVSKAVRITEIIPEGAMLTKEDVEAERILVRFDAAPFEDQLYEMESNFESAKALLTESEESLEIQKSENESNIRSAKLEVTFTMNDLRKLVGDKLAEQFALETPEDIRKLLDHPDLGGQALQDLRKLQGDIELEKEELSRAENKLKWTQKLAEQGYVTGNEHETDALAKRRRELSLQQAEAKLDIFRRYEFVKEFQKTWATLLEAKDKLERQKAVARSKLAQAQAQLNSRQANFARAKERLNNLREDIENCVIRAERPGFVVYEAPPRWRNEGPLQSGSEVRRKQSILRLPDLTVMACKVNIHEAQIDHVAVGMKASLSVDAFPNQRFEGTVTKKAVLPSSQSTWLNPDLKVYETEITITGENSALRPGMTATVDILCENLDDVLYIPIQSVQTNDDDSHYCYMAEGSQRTVKIGKRNHIFVGIEDGLKEGELILMSPPALAAE